MDTELLNREFDLLGMVAADTALTGHGAWSCGPCPFCGGADRFVLHRTNDGYRWFCRGCGDGKYHTAVDYVIRRENVEFQEAIIRMGGSDQQRGSSWSERARRVAEIGADLHQPPLDWRRRGSEYVETCRQNLWKPVGSKALGWLRGRGFKEWAIAKYKLGFQPRDDWETLEKWGLDGDGKVALARGITIPCSGPAGLYYIKTRRAIPPGSKEKKYLKVRGSKAGVFGWSNLTGQLSVVTEGEFDAMILDQEAGGSAQSCTFGSATDSPLNVDPELLRWYYKTDQVGLAFDNDEQGQLGARAFQEKLPRTRILNLPPAAKDINELLLNGGNIAEWLTEELLRLEML